MNKRYYVVVDGKINSFDTQEEAKHFAGLWKAEGREVCIKEMWG